MAYHRRFCTDTRIQRPLNVYSPRIRQDGLYGRVVPRYIQQALSGKDITIHGDGMQTRSFLYVSDWVDATWRMITLDRLNGDIFNVESPDKITILKLANLIVNMT
jgi:UDP-glucuronate decarboxylase